MNSDKKNPKNDSDESNYIKKDEENKSEKKESEESIFKKLKNLIWPATEEIRSLGKEVGGTEVDYKKEQKAADEDIDTWDKLEKGKNSELPPAKEGDDFETSAQESFIHAKKRGRGKRGKLGPMTLNPQAPIKAESVEKQGANARQDGKVPTESTLSMVARFGKTNNENDRGGFSR